MTLFANFPRSTPDWQGNNPKLGTASWLGLAQPYASGQLWLGRNEKGEAVGVADNRHILTVAGSRVGKGTSLIIPNLCLWPGSTVVVDPKGENAARTARNRAEIEGHRVVVLDPFNEAGMPDELLGSFNPLDTIDTGEDDAIDLAAVLASALVMHGNDRDIHWDESARQIIEAIILHVCDTEEAPERRTLARVRQLLNGGDTEFRDQMLEAGAEGVNAFDALWAHMAESEAENENVRDVIIGAAETVTAMGNNERGSVLSTARRNTRFLGTPRVQRTLASTSFNIDDLKSHEGGMSLYLCLPARYLATHARWLRLIVNQILFRMEAIGLEQPASGHPVLFVLDEFAALGHLESLEKAAGLMAGYGIKLWPILQDLTQLKRHYKESWETFLGNAGTITFFGNTDLTTLEWISKRMGETELTRENKGTSVSLTSGTSTATGTSEQEGTSAQSGRTATESDMAALAQLSTVQGGQNFLELITRRAAPTTARSDALNESQGSSSSKSSSETTTASTSETKGHSKQEQVLKTPLMTPDEIASHFDREAGKQIVFIGGRGPFAVWRTAYFEDEAFCGLYSP